MTHTAVSEPTLDSLAKPAHIVDILDVEPRPVRGMHTAIPRQPPFGLRMVLHKALGQALVLLVPDVLQDSIVLSQRLLATHSSERRPGLGILPMIAGGQHRADSVRGLSPCGLDVPLHQRDGHGDERQGSVWVAWRVGLD